MREVITLNEYALSYLNTDLAYNARCIGSNPTDKNYPNNLTGSARQNQMYSSEYEYMDGYNGSFWKEDTNYGGNDNNKDLKRLESIGALLVEDATYDTRYWLASHRIYSQPNRIYFMSRFIDSSGNLNSTGVFYIDSDASSHMCAPEFGFRPVFYLNSSVKITGGEGTENSPYQLVENQE